MATDRSFEDFQFKAWMGASAAGIMDVSDPVAYGLNRAVKGKGAAAQAAWMKSNIGTGWRFSGMGQGNLKYSHLRMRPGDFQSRFMKSWSSTFGPGLQPGVNPKAAAGINKIFFGQSKFYGGRGAETLRRLSTRRVMTSAGRERAAGYFSKKMWDLAGAKGRTLRPALVRAGIGRVGSVASKVLRAGWGATLLYEVAESSVKMLRQGARKASALEWGKGFEITQGLYTERQRAVQAITSSRMSSRSAIGGEAALMHR